MGINPRPQLSSFAVICPGGGGRGGARGGIHSSPPIWITSDLKRIDACLLNSLMRADTHLQSDQLTLTHHPPCVYVQSLSDWYFISGLPGALFAVLAEPVYHYWSLSQTWTNRSPFSKVVSQVAVTELSGTAELRARLRHTGSHEKPGGTQARRHRTLEADSLRTTTHCSRGPSGCLIRAGLMRPARTDTPSLWSNKPSTSIKAQNQVNTPIAYKKDRPSP